MQKLKLGMAFNLVGVIFGLLVTGTSFMLMSAFHGHITADLAQREWALSWAWFLGKGTVAIAVAVAVLALLVRIAIFIKRR